MVTKIELVKLLQTNDQEFETLKGYVTDVEDGELLELVKKIALQTKDEDLHTSLIGTLASQQLINALVTVYG